MKRLLSAITLLLAFTAGWADSPLTSTHFAEAYSDHPMVQMASQEMQYDIPTTLLNFLANKNEPVDVRLAVINKIGWNFDGTTVGAQLEQYLMGRYNVKTEKKLVKKLDAGTLAVFAYARAMSNYFDVTAAQALAQQAVKKNKNKSFSVALIDAQFYHDSDWSMIYMLVILTAVEKVSINFNKPDQKDLDRMTIAEAREYIKQGHFAPGSMLPKVESCISFVENTTGGTALITSLDKAREALQGKTGTLLVK